MTNQTPIGALVALFKQYTPHEIATALFAIDTWLPNVSSTFKLIQIYAAFLSIPETDFTASKSLDNYAAFEKLFNKIKQLTPGSMMMEDFVPNQDWGEVRYYYENSSRFMLYGSDIEYPYDFLKAFQLSFVNGDFSDDKENPNVHLNWLLEIHTCLTSQLANQPEEFPDLDPGHLECPSASHWKDCRSLSLEACLDQRDINLIAKSGLCAQLGVYSSQTPSTEQATSLFYSNDILQFFAINVDGILVPMLPRNYVAVVINHWERELASTVKANTDAAEDFRRKLSIHLSVLLGERLNTSSLMPIVAALDAERKPVGPVFSCVFQSGSKLIPIYIPKMQSDGTSVTADLNSAVEELQAAIEELRKPPHRMGLLANGKYVELRPNSASKNQLKIEPVSILPVTLTMGLFQIPTDLPGKVFSLPDFLQIVDDIDDISDFGRFLDFLDEHADMMMPIASTADRWAAFKDSSGVIIPGSQKTDMLILATGWATDRRFKRLCEFWSMYPSHCEIGGDAGRWHLEARTETSTAYHSKGESRDIGLITRIEDCFVISSSAFNKYEYKDGSIAFFLLEAIDDTLSRFGPRLCNTSFFSRNFEIRLGVYPSDFAQTADAAMGIGDVIPEPGIAWSSKLGMNSCRIPFLIMVYNEHEVLQIAEKAEDNSLAIDITTDILRSILVQHDDDKLSEVIDHISTFRSERPRFKLTQTQRRVAFPDFAQSRLPLDIHHKTSRKRIADICKEMGLERGEYTGDAAKNNLNELRKVLVDHINDEVSTYDFASSITIAIESINALDDKHQRTTLDIEQSLSHEVEYDRQERLAKADDEYRSMHWSYRYLIEKLVQLAPAGATQISDEAISHIIALIDKLYEVYSVSDSIHYEIVEPTLEIMDDYRVLPRFDDAHKESEAIFGEELAAVQLRGKELSKFAVEPRRDIESIMDEINAAFKADHGFELRELVNVLQVLSTWPYRQTEDTVEKASYQATIDEIGNICSSSIRGFDTACLPALLGFLTLKTEDMLLLIDSDEDADDLPVWEYKKRPTRYRLKPLVQIGDIYLWGAYSTHQSAGIWAMRPASGEFPYTLNQQSELAKVLSKLAKELQHQLEVKALEITKQHTDNAYRSVDLHKRFKSAGHPSDLGDYDVLAYLPSKKVVLAIEAKHLIKPYCQKDTKRLRDEIFDDSGNKRYLAKFERRHDYLKADLTRTAELFKIDPEELTDARLVSVMVSELKYWWTRFPVRPTEVRFEQITLLDDLIQTL